MPPIPKNLPRFLPTLTEVVDVARTHPPHDGGADNVSPSRHSDNDALVDRIMARLDGPLQARLAEAISQLAIEHFRRLEPLLRDEVDSAVRRAVDEAIAKEPVVHPIAK